MDVQRGKVCGGSWAPGRGWRTAGARRYLESLKPLPPTYTRPRSLSQAVGGPAAAVNATSSEPEKEHIFPSQMADSTFVCAIARNYKRLGDHGTMSPGTPKKALLARIFSRFGCMSTHLRPSFMFLGRGLPNKNKKKQNLELEGHRRSPLVGPWGPGPR